MNERQDAPDAEKAALILIYAGIDIFGALARWGLR
jgi:hypothetical protein